MDLLSNLHLIEFPDHLVSCIAGLTVLASEPTSLLATTKVFFHLATGVFGQ